MKTNKTKMSSGRRYITYQGGKMETSFVILNTCVILSHGIHLALWIISIRHKYLLFLQKCHADANPNAIYGAINASGFAHEIVLMAAWHEIDSTMVSDNMGDKGWRTYVLNQLFNDLLLNIKVIRFTFGLCETRKKIVDTNHDTEFQSNHSDAWYSTQLSQQY